MPVLRTVSSAAIVVALATPALSDHWVSFSDATAERLVAAANVGADDVKEKDYAVGDLDLDGDDDVVVVRKQPWTSTGRESNVLLMNEDGVLVDRTLEYASASDVPGDMGFLTPTNDRDVVITDVNNDTWPDVVTAVSLTDNEPVHLSHPRVYINLGEQDGDWLGLRYEVGRIPQLHPFAGPRFLSVSAGDITGNGFVDLYFTDHDSGGNQLFDFDNVLLINDGTGHFADGSDALTFQMRDSAFGASSAIADMNGDGANDLVRTTSLDAPTEVGVSYNDPNDPGQFIVHDSPYLLGPYFCSVADLNGDGAVDIIVTDAGIDRYLLNIGNDKDGIAQFSSHVLGGVGFGGNNLAADLNRSGRLDIIITDVDTDIPGCTRTTNFYRNRGGDPVQFTEEMAIPANDAEGIHDVAVLDIDGDEWPDLVVGSCTGTTVYLQLPPTCGGDATADGEVDVEDLVAVVSAWGPCGSECPEDFNGDGVVNVDDLVVVILRWGICS